MGPRASFPVAQIRLFISHVLETEGTNVEFGSLAVLVRVRRVVPAVNLEPAELNSVNVFYLRRFL